MVKIWSELATPAKVVFVIGLIQTIILVLLMAFGVIGTIALGGSNAAPVAGMEIGVFLIIIVVGVLNTLFWTWITNMIYKWNPTVAWVMLVILIVLPGLLLAMQKQSSNEE